MVSAWSSVRVAVFADEVSAVARGVDNLVRAALAVLEFVDFAGTSAALNGDAGCNEVTDLE